MGSSAARFHFFILPHGLKRDPGMDVHIFHAERCGRTAVLAGRGEGPVCRGVWLRAAWHPGKGMRGLTRDARRPLQNTLSPWGDMSAEQAGFCIQAPRHGSPSKRFLSAWDAHPLLFCLNRSQGALGGRREVGSSQVSGCCWRNSTSPGPLISAHNGNSKAEYARVS